MTDAWSSYQAVLEPEKQITGKGWTQRIERHNLNLRTHLKRLNRRLCIQFVFTHKTLVQ